VASSIERGWANVQLIAKGSSAHLRRGGLAHLLAEAVADVHAEEAGERIQVAPPRDVLEIAAVAANDHLQLARVGVAAHPLKWSHRWSSAAR
jgi:hypothetical protein